MNIIVPTPGLSLQAPLGRFNRVEFCALADFSVSDRNGTSGQHSGPVKQIWTTLAVVDINGDHRRTSWFGLKYRLTLLK